MYIEVDKTPRRPGENVLTDGSYEAARDIMLINIELGYQWGSDTELMNRMLMDATTLSAVKREPESARRRYIDQTTQAFQMLSRGNEVILERTKRLEAMLHIVLAVPAADMSKSARE